MFAKEEEEEEEEEAEKASQLLAPEISPFLLVEDNNKNKSSSLPLFLLVMVVMVLLLPFLSFPFLSFLLTKLGGGCGAGERRKKQQQGRELCVGYCVCLFACWLWLSGKGERLRISVIFPFGPTFSFRNVHQLLLLLLLVTIVY